MLRQARSSILEHGLVEPGHHVLAAVSGGADSTALLVALHALTGELRCRLSAVHLHHGIRGAAADADAAFVARLCAQLGVPLRSGRSDVPARARRRGLSLEAAAREARYAFFARAARELSAHAAATAHTADDQAETVLLRLARGAGRRGLGGMAPATTLFGLRVIRPMLAVSRRQVEAFLRRRGMTWREDVSNRDGAFLRNRVRHEILPLLAGRLNPEVRDALCRTAGILREEDAWLDRLAAEALEECRCGGPGGDEGSALALERLDRLCAGARGRVLRLWLTRGGAPADRAGFDAVGRVVALLAHRCGSRSVPIGAGWNVRRAYDRLLLERSGDTAPDPACSRRVAVPGETLIPGQGWRIVTRLARGLYKPRRSRVGSLPGRASLRAADALKRGLLVRSWRPGDRIRPHGMEGSKKIQDVFTDAKVPAAARSAVPVFECRGEIVWVPGYRVARGWEVRDTDLPALQIAVDRV